MYDAHAEKRIEELQARIREMERQNGQLKEKVCYWVFWLCFIASSVNWFLFKSYHFSVAQKLIAEFFVIVIYMYLYFLVHWYNRLGARKGTWPVK